MVDTPNSGCLAVWLAGVDGNAGRPKADFAGVAVASLGADTAPKSDDDEPLALVFPKVLDVPEVLVCDVAGCAPKPNFGTSVFEDEKVAVLLEPKAEAGFGASDAAAGADGAKALAGLDATPKLNLTGAAPLDVLDAAGTVVGAGVAGLLNENVGGDCVAGAAGAVAAPVLEGASFPANPPMRANSEDAAL